MRFHHVGYAVRDIENASMCFRNLGFLLVGKRTLDQGRNVYIQFLKASFSDDVLIELVAPNNTTVVSPIDGVLRKSGDGPYHLCYLTDDLDRQIRILQCEGYVLVQQPSYAPALSSDVAFLYRAGFGLIELLEERRTEVVTSDLAGSP